MKTLLVSNFVFGGQNVYGYCDSKCDRITKHLDDFDCGVGFTKFPVTHSKWCVRSCERFRMIEKDRDMTVITLFEEVF